MSSTQTPTRPDSAGIPTPPQPKSNKVRIVGIVVAGIVALAVIATISGDGTKTAAPAGTTAPGAQTASFQPSTAPSSSPPEADAPAAPGTTLDSPIAFGDSANVGKWSIKVVKYTPDATAAIANENMFNDSPKSGSQFAMAMIRATYTGSNASDPFMDLTWTLISRDGSSYAEVGFAVLPDDLSDVGKVPNGVAGEGTIAFEVKSSDASSGAIYFAPNSYSGNGGVFFAVR